MVTPLAPGGTSQPRLDSRRSDEIAVACLVVAIDGAHPLTAPSRHWLIGVDEVRLCRSADSKDRRHDRAARRPLTLWLADPMVSGRHAVVRRAQGHWVVADEGSRNGTLVNGQPIREQRLVDGDVIVVGSVGMVFRDVVVDRSPERPDETADQLYPRGLPKGMWTMSPSLERDFDAALRTARSTASVVILGETGTGKELAARAIHALSARTGLFVPVNCGGLSAELIGSEMFGHQRGAFSGAVADKEGLVTSASKGTLFLDEVAELPLTMQAALLRALQDGEVRPVGATRTLSVDLRVITATHADLPVLVRAKKFREDLWSRLAGYVIRLPALRDRKDDLGLLLRGILGRLGAGGTAFSFEATAALIAYAWPRNVRQFEQVIEQALVQSAGDEILLHHLPAEVQSRPVGGREQLVELLRRHKGSTVKVAAEEGVSRQAIEKRCRVLSIDYKTFRGAARSADDDS